MWAMIVKGFRELRRDRPTMAMLIALPIIMLIVFGYAANFSVHSITTNVYGPSAEAVASKLKSPFTVEHTDASGTRADAEHALVNNQADLAIITASALRRARRFCRHTRIGAPVQFGGGRESIWPPVAAPRLDCPPRLARRGRPRITTQVQVAAGAGQNVAARP